MRKIWLEGFDFVPPQCWVGWPVPFPQQLAPSRMPSTNSLLVEQTPGAQKQ